MANNILFVFEGEKTEGQIVASMNEFFLNEHTIVTCVYGAEIYQIYKAIAADEDLDTFNLLKERNARNREILEPYTRDDFAEIHMFFDYDGHSTLASDQVFLALLELFDEETDKGKLYISYPMVESLKHICAFDTFKDLNVACKINISYKSIVNDTCIKELVHFKKYTIEIWKQLILGHLMKMNFVVHHSYSLPSTLVTQNEIFIRQLEKYIAPSSTVAVLSGFPPFLHDYYGNEGLLARIT